ncbi:MAG: leucine-rich repeat protein, partial [Clostridiales bacterium]|nr:leucine-rich repeat protein [Clostridiales bacterium]
PYGNANIKTVTIGSSVASIGDYAFRNCPALRFAYILSTDCSFGPDSFTKTDILTIYSYEGSTAQSYADSNGIAFALFDHIHTHESEVVDATCTEQGYTAHICTICGESYEDIYTDALGHSWGEGIVTTEPTYISTGVMTYTCTICGETMEEELAVLPGPGIVTQPESLIAVRNTTATFSVYAVGDDLTWQWQKSTDSGVTWQKISGETADTLQIKATSSRNGNQFRCIVTDGSCETVVSEAAVLTVKSKLLIKTHPQDQTVAQGATATFTVAAKGDDLTWQWQKSSDNGNSWKNITGEDTDTLTVKGTSARNGWQYRCVVTDGFGESVTSNAATLTVKVKLAIKTQPKSQSVTQGSVATFTVAAVGNSLTWKWQWSSNGKTWYNQTGSSTGFNTATLKVNATSARNGYLYRCIVTDGDGNSVTSSVATLTVVKKLAITVQPKTQSVAKGSTAIFSVTASGGSGSLTYRWQWSRNGKTWYFCTSSFSGYNTARVRVTATSSVNGNRYRCVVTDGTGYTVTSVEAVLNVLSAATDSAAAASLDTPDPALLTETDTAAAISETEAEENTETDGVVEAETSDEISFAPATSEELLIVETEESEIAEAASTEREDTEEDFVDVDADEDAASEQLIPDDSLLLNEGGADHTDALTKDISEDSDSTSDGSSEFILEIENVTDSATFESSNENSTEIVESTTENADNTAQEEDADFTLLSGDISDIVARGSCGQALSWTLSVQGTLRIFGSGEMNDYNSIKDSPWCVNRTEIQAIILDDGVTCIGTHAFDGCEKLKAVSMASSIIRIGQDAFASCATLTSIQYGGTVGEWCIAYNEIT